MKLIFVVGPTASGKSHFALESALHLNKNNIKAEIMNCDSLQVYKALDIGTAKPSLTERALVEHWLFDFVAVGQLLTAGDYRKIALEKMREREQCGVGVMFLVGGSGFYFHAVEHGMFDLGKVPIEIHHQVQLEARDDLNRLYQELLLSDPDYAKKISVNDSYRIQRAVEIMRAFGDSPSRLRNRFVKEPLPYDIIKIGMTRQKAELRELVELRTQKMFKAGLIAETQSLIAKGLGEWSPLSSVGYKETKQFINGEITETALHESVVQNTMRLAKKQMTWFKRDPQIKWFDSKTEMNKAFESIL